jgi:preprotein translocase subunit SecG
MEQLVMAVHVLVAIAIIALVLLQQGKGAEMGASFGSGGSQTLFGSQGSGNFLSHSTAILVAVFFATSIGLSLLAKHKVQISGDTGVPAAELIQAHNAAAAAEKPTVPAGDAPAVGDAPVITPPTVPTAVDTPAAPVTPEPAQAPAQ